MAKIKSGKNASKKDIIIKKAALLFRTKGFNAASMRELAEAVGVEAPSLYNHIGSKSELLQAIWRYPYMPELLNSLPLLGEDGTLARRFRQSDLKGRTRLKTGTLRDVSAIAGYMLTRSGKRMIIVMQQNGQRSAGFGHSLQNMLLEWVFEQ